MDGHTVDTTVMTARVLYKEGSYEKAVSYYEALLKYFLKDKYTWNNGKMQEKLHKQLGKKDECYVKKGKAAESTCLLYTSDAADEL